MNVILGLVFAGMGLYYALEGFGIIPMYSSPRVEPWVIGCAGVFMFFLGVFFVAPGFFGGKDSETSRDADGTLVIKPVEQLGTLIGLWMFSIALTAFVVAFWRTLYTPGPDSGSTGVAVFVLSLFSLMAVAGLIASVRQTLSALRFGYVPVHLSGGRPCLGGKVTGYLDAPAIGRFRKARAELKCQHFWKTVTQSNGKSSSSINETTAWQSVHFMDFEPRGGSIRMTFEFRIPGDVFPTNLHGGTVGLGELALGEDYFRWELHISGDIPGVDLVRSYFIPVDPAGQPKTEGDHQQAALDERIAAVHKVALAELAAGRTAAQVVAKLESYGIGSKTIIEGLEGLLKDHNPPRADEVQQQIASMKRVLAEMDSGQLMMLRRPRS